MAQGSATNCSGVINANEMYTLTQIKLRLGLTASAMRNLRRLGFPLIRIGKRAYASGKNVIAFFERMQDASSC